MQGESRLLDVFDDLEQQAAGLYLADRDAEVGELRVSEYATVTLASRCRAALGRDLGLRLVGGVRVDARLVRAGAEWLVLQDQQACWLVPLEAVTEVRGVTSESRHESTWSVADRLPLRALLRRLAEDDPDCRVHLRDGGSREVRLARVGADFVELRPQAEPHRDPYPQDRQHRGAELIATSALAGVRWRDQ